MRRRVQPVRRAVALRVAGQHLAVDVGVVHVRQVPHPHPRVRPAGDHPVGPDGLRDVVIGRARAKRDALDQPAANRSAAATASHQ